jgi:hypothetical protein
MRLLLIALLFAVSAVFAQDSTDQSNHLSGYIVSHSKTDVSIANVDTSGTTNVCTMDEQEGKLVIGQGLDGAQSIQFLSRARASVFVLNPYTKYFVGNEEVTPYAFYKHEGQTLDYRVIYGSGPDGSLSVLAVVLYNIRG